MKELFIWTWQAAYTTLAIYIISMFFMSVPLYVSITTFIILIYLHSWFYEDLKHLFFKFIEKITDFRSQEQRDIDNKKEELAFEAFCQRNKKKLEQLRKKREEANNG